MIYSFSQLPPELSVGEAGWPCCPYCKQDLTWTYQDGRHEAIYPGGPEQWKRVSATWARWSAVDRDKDLLYLWCDTPGCLQMQHLLGMVTISRER